MNHGRDEKKMGILSSSAVEEKKEEEHRDNECGPCEVCYQSENDSNIDENYSEYVPHATKLCEEKGTRIKYNEARTSRIGG